MIFPDQLPQFSNSQLFAIMPNMTAEITLQPGLRRGTVTVPLSKSHLHRLMIADFLAGRNGADGEDATAFRRLAMSQAEDILATQCCLDALLADVVPCLPCRESGSTLRFLMPVAMSCCSDAFFSAEGRLPQRPIGSFLDILAQHGVSCLSRNESTGSVDFPLHLKGRLQPGDFVLPGNISSQYFTGLLLALPILDGDSRIRLSSPMESKGYVDMTIQVIRSYGISVVETEEGYDVPGRQKYVRRMENSPEIDWSGAAFWLAMNKMGSDVMLPALPMESRQPDKQIVQLLDQVGGTIDVSQCPDIFPVLSVAAAAFAGDTLFVGVRRLRMKESDRLAAMQTVLQLFGVQCDNEEDSFVVHGMGPHFKGNVVVDSFNDHRIAMSAAVAATLADGPVTIQTPSCVKKSYPDFFEQYLGLVMA